jgi:hypothetical protein
MVLSMSSLFLWNGNVVARHVDAKLLHAAQQRGALYSQTNGRSMGPRDDAIGQFERAQDLGPLRLVQHVIKASLILFAAFVAVAKIEFAEINGEHRTLRDDHGPLNHILEFSNVAGPMITGQRLHGVRRDTFNRATVSPAEFPDKVPDERGDVFYTLA